MKRKMYIFTVIITTMFLFIVSSAVFVASPKSNVKGQNVTYTTYSDDTRYSETAIQNVEKESFYYSRKEVASYKINNTFPDYFNTNTSLTNTCANVAGANVIGYYDRYFDDLIPDCASGILRGTNYTYYGMVLNKAKRQSVIDRLYTTMKTNTTDNGTTESDCLEGLTTYVQEKGRGVSYSSVMTDSALDFQKLDMELKQGKPVMFFLSGYNFVSMIDSGSEVSLTINEYAGNHIIVAYGYQKIAYYDGNNNLIKSNIYIHVSSGLENVKGFYLLNIGGNIDSAKAVDIM